LETQHYSRKAITAISEKGTNVTLKIPLTSSLDVVEEGEEIESTRS
jgi:hypothetical protein